MGLAGGPGFAASLRRAGLRWNGGNVLELGERVRVVAPPDRMNEISRCLGDSYRKLDGVDVPSLAGSSGSSPLA